MEKTSIRRAAMPVAVLVAGAAVTVTLGGCSHQSPGTAGAQAVSTPSAAPSVPVTPSASADTGSARSLATAAYLGMWRDMATASRTADWEAPALAHHATGAALSAISRGLYADHLNGLVAKGAPKDYPVVTSMDPSVDPTTVMISDCGDSSQWLQYRKDTGKLADNRPGGRQAITAEVKQQGDGSWKVTRFAVEAVDSC
ncbi:hypothetical protein POF50_011225 [Streptomyces sp. SL13]|uniref:Secreted protein/lipoprotein n=1 Tax=Streptantibioticus silvisoli TaxID=2705255 RepID=A0AA90KFZ5_9ACTN|nr:hypothetical protein [Streptantibioticus silvisoli]MDI5969900.1 hypothetical protein [Streptantibioticus silvisoli]